jgi:hypothetical protein
MSIENLEEKLDASILSIKNAVVNLKSNMIDISNKQIELDKKIEKLDIKELEICCREKKLLELEHNYIERLEQLIQKEKQIEKEQEEGRKVSILKNIQIQLSQKTSECELLTKQLKLYKSRSELLNNLCNKHNINMEALQFMIEKTIIMQNMSSGNETPKVDELPKVDETPKVDELSQNVNPDDKITERTNNQQTIENAQHTEEVIEEGIEVDLFEYKGKQYYIDNNSGDIYAKLEDDEVGDVIGYRTEKGIVKFGHRKK